MESGPVVLATGGGAFVDPQTRALVNHAGTAIWLDADIATLVARVGRRSHRPLLVGRNPGEVLTALAAARNPCYAEAAVHVRSEDGPHERTVDAILSILKAA